MIVELPKIQIINADGEVEEYVTATSRIAYAIENLEFSKETEVTATDSHIVVVVRLTLDDGRIVSGVASKPLDIRGAASWADTIATSRALHLLGIGFDPESIASAEEVQDARSVAEQTKKAMLEKRRAAERKARQGAASNAIKKLEK